MVPGAAGPRLTNLMQPCSKCTDPARAVMAFLLPGPGRLAAPNSRPASTASPTYPLCLRHADRFVAPVGWRLDDRRGRLEQPLLTADVA